MANQHGRHVTTPDENRPSWQPPDERELRHWDESPERTAAGDAPSGYGFDEGERPRFVQHSGYLGGSAYGRLDRSYAPGPRTAGHRGKGPKGFMRSDERIREHVSELLTEHDEIDATNLDVQVKDGEVTLAGTVDDRHQRRMVEQVVEGVSGVRDVHMSIKLRDDHDATSEADLRNGRA